MLIAVGLVLMCAVASVRLEPLHPAVLWLLPFTASAVLLELGLIPYVQGLSAWTVALVLGGSAAFVAGTLVAGRIVSGGDVDAAPERPLALRQATIAAGVMAMLTLIALIAFLVQIADAYGIRDAVVSSSVVRRAIQAGGYPVTVKYVYGALAAAALCGVRAGLGDGRRRWLALGAACALSTYFSTGRSTVVLAFLVLAVGTVMSRGRMPSRRRFFAAVAVSAIGAVAALLVGGALIGKTFVKSELAMRPNFFRSHPIARPLGLPYLYATASIPALETVVATSSATGAARGCAVAAPACTLIGKAGLDVHAVPRIRPFTPAPFAWNTYTAIERPLIDGGRYLAIPILLVTGVLVGLLWRLARRGHIVACACYAVLACAPAQAYGDYNFTSPLMLGGAVGCAAALLAAGLVVNRRRSGA